MFSQKYCLGFLLYFLTNSKHFFICPLESVASAPRTLTVTSLPSAINVGETCLMTAVGDVYIEGQWSECLRKSRISCQVTSVLHVP